MTETNTIKKEDSDKSYLQEWNQGCIPVKEYDLDPFMGTLNHLFHFFLVIYFPIVGIIFYVICSIVRLGMGRAPTGGEYTHTIRTLYVLGALLYLYL